MIHMCYKQESVAHNSVIVHLLCGDLKDWGISEVEIDVNSAALSTETRKRERQRQ